MHHGEDAQIPMLDQIRTNGDLLYSISILDARILPPKSDHIIRKDLNVSLKCKLKMCS